MVKAGDKHSGYFGLGQGERYHTVKQDGEQFWLCDVVRVTTKSGKVVFGEIKNITEKSIDIQPKDKPVKTIKYKDIKNIS